MTDSQPPSVPLPVRILTVGDGDLTLSLALARAYAHISSDKLELVASTLLSSQQELIQTYSNSRDVLNELEERNVAVLFGVDATNLASADGSTATTDASTFTTTTTTTTTTRTVMNGTSIIENNKWDAILFHHPHLAGSIADEEAHAHRHYVLLAHYFASAKPCLKYAGGIVHVCLCGRQGDTWRVMEAAQRQGLQLIQQVSTTIPIHQWLLPQLEVDQASEVLSHYPAPRRYRNGKLGSKHFLGRYGYRHRRTHGDQAVGGGDVNVNGSLHYIFGNNNDNDDAIHDLCYRHEQSVPSLSRKNTCAVCGTRFESLDEVLQHCQSPALPDPVNTTTKKEMKVSRGAHEASSNGVVDRNTTAACSSRLGRDDSIVNEEHDGKRLKWYLRQSLFASKACGRLSKQQTERMITDGRVSINGVTVLDSGRFLHGGDVIVVTPDKTSNDDKATRSLSSASNTVELCHESQHVVVAFKPVGMRAIGSFSDSTLEMIVSAQVGEPLTVVSTLDTGCAGLCILQRHAGEAREVAQVIEVSHVFTALVHDRVSEEWNGQSLDLPIEGMRRWRQKGGDRTKKSDETQTSREDERPAVSATGDSIEISVLERTATVPSTPPLLSDGGGQGPALTTLQIVTSSRASGLCNAICYLLRKRGHPVVNDRLCRREYLALPRSIRNLIKNRLCIGCFQVNMMIAAHEAGRSTATNVHAVDTCTEQTVAVEIPVRLRASHWQKHCEA